MTAPMSAPYMLPSPASSSKRANNQEAVAGLLRQKYRESQIRASKIPTTSATTPATSTSSQASTANSPPPGCPMHAGGSRGAASSSSRSSPPSDSINPANNMPFNLSFSDNDDESSSSRVKLSQNRVVSSIPRGSTSPLPGASPYDAPTTPPSACPVAHKKSGETSNDDEPSRWEYPSAAQFQAALARKNKAAPSKHVEMMVLVHNFMNEEAWKLVVDWEKEFIGERAREDVALLRFEGRPGELSPRARWYSWMGSLFPSRYSSEPPFDRHDWIVSRPDGTTARYVIDYYGDEEADARDEARRRARLQQEKEGKIIKRAEDEEDEDDDQARFILDVRPALDSFEAIRVRARRAFQEYRQASSA